MKISRPIRQAAFQALYQLDLRGEQDAEAITDAFLADKALRLKEEEIGAAIELARRAFGDRRAADDAMGELAPTWPAPRQPAVDRALLRLAHYEISSGVTPPKLAVNEAIELAKRFSTERSPAFLNGLLDKVLKRALASAAEARSPAEPEG